MIPALTSGFISGIALASFFHISSIYFYAFLGLFLICFVYRFFVEGEDRKRLTVVSVFFLFVLIGIGRVNISNLYSESKLVQFENEKVEIIGVIVAEPDTRETNTKLTVVVEEVNKYEAKPSDRIAVEDGRPIQTWSGFREKILVTVPLYPEFKYGDRVKGNVILSKPKAIESEDGRVFDYIGYLKVRGIWYTSRFTSLEVLSSGHGNKVKTMLFKTKEAFTDSISEVLPEPQSSLLSGLLLGSKQSLGKEILSEFQRTGTSHIVVLSGYNIAIVAESIMNSLKFFLKTDASPSVQTTFLKGMFSPKNVSFGFGAVGIILFTMLSGGGASATRAAIMVLVALYAKRSNRDYKASRVLGFTIVLMLAPNPLLLIFDPSFQLSVLATIGLIFVSPIVENYLKQRMNKFGSRLNNPKRIVARTLQSKVLGEILATTIATQITVLPFLIYNTGMFSLVSLPVNVLILGTIPLTMLLGFVTGIFGLVSFYLSIVPAVFTYALLWYQLKIVHIGSALSFGAISLPSFSPIFLIFIYAGIFMSLRKNRKSTR